MPLRHAHRLVAADQFVVGHAAVCQRHGTPSLDVYPCSERKAWSKDDCVEQIAFKAQEAGHGTIIKWAWKG